MKRRAHYLPGNKGQQQPNQIIWFDTETHFKLGADRRQYHYLWFGWACYQRREKGEAWRYPEWFRFTTLDEFWSWTLSKTRPKTRLYLMSHNGAFDLPVMHAFSELPARGWTLTSAVVDAPPMILTWRKGSESIRFVDTLNIWRMPLAAVGESVGIPKIAMPAQSGSRKAWDTYGRRDVEVIRTATLKWLEFLRDEDLGGFAPTLASQAMTAYRHRFMHERILIDENQDAAELGREAYVGGRVECFQLGSFSGDYYLLDVNSMYPAVMAAHQYPCQLLGVYGRPTHAEISKWLTHRGVIAQVELDTDEPAYPLVMDGRLIFPVGRFSCTLAGPELAYALGHGHLVSCSRAAVYVQADLFSEFVNYMHKMRIHARSSGDLVRAWLFKICMNSLYGKFGQRGRRFEETGTADPDEVDVWSELDLDSGEVRHMRKFGGIEQTWVDEGESRDSMPAIAAYVTAHARMVLWKAITRVGRGNCLYCDTDSLVVNREGFERIHHLIDADQLGAWSLERELQRITLHGPKDYVFDGEVKVKGVRHSATWLADALIAQDYFVGFRGLLRSGSLDAPVVFEIRKHLKREYLKGIVGADGRVSPFRLYGDGTRR